ncbi:MAG: glycosyltransferase family 39 protein [Anaerolineales bacterium]|nr:glycosyltransferase family 39 protein [Anaerolineales bacterium]
MQEKTFFSTRASRTIALFIIFILGIGIRFYDLTDLPLDFHSTRQLLSAIKARGMYYSTRMDVATEYKSFAVQQWQFRASVEPEFFERVVAFTYQFTGEQVWIARIYSSMFWMIGAIFLFLLARKLTNIDGAIASTAIYVFLPYAIIASRSFQPDPLMTMLIIIFLWAVYEWSEKQTYKFAIIAGLFGGFAIFIKFVAAFFVISGGLGAVTSHKSIKEALKNPQLYVMSILGIIPGAAYLIYGIFFTDYLGQQFGGRFIPTLFLSPSYYVGWLNMLNLVIGGFVLMVALFGLFFYDDKKRRFILSLWLGYLTFGIYFNFHISTHDYYSLPLIPIVALSIASLASFIFTKLSEITNTKFLRISAFCFLLFGLVASVWNTRNILNATNYRPEEKMWQEISQIIDGYNVAGLTQDYGSRMAYFGWRSITDVPSYGDILYSIQRTGKDDFEERFNAIISKKDLFLVTDFRDLNRQPLLKEKLETYPIFAEGDGYVIFDLMK